MGLGATGSDIGTPAPNSRHDVQFFGNFLQGRVLGKSLKGVNHSLLVGHRETVSLYPAGGKRTRAQAFKVLVSSITSRTKPATRS